MVESQRSREEKPVLLEVANGIAIVTLNRPAALNTLSSAMIEGLLEAFSAVNDDDGVQVIIVTGRGKAFCAGVDLKSLQDNGSLVGSANLGPEAQIVKCLAECKKPIVAAINGAAVTGGFELALACDFLYASQPARFADTHALVGLLPGWGLSQKLPRLVGVNRARELSFTGRFLSADQALEWGLVNAVATDDELIPSVIRIADQICSTNKNALYGIKRLYNDGWQMPLGDALRMEGQRAGVFNASVSFSDMPSKLAKLQARSKS